MLLIESRWVWSYMELIVDNSDEKLDKNEELVIGESSNCCWCRIDSMLKIISSKSFRSK